MGSGHSGKLSYSFGLNVGPKARKVWSPISSESIPSLALLWGALDVKPKAQVLAGSPVARCCVWPLSVFEQRR